jgi:hypothetical protein
MAFRKSRLRLRFGAAASRKGYIGKAKPFRTKGSWAAKNPRSLKDKTTYPIGIRPIAAPFHVQQAGKSGFSGDFSLRSFVSAPRMIW